MSPIGAAVIIPVVVLVVIVLIIVLWWISSSNKFKRMKVKIDESFADIGVALTKRYDVLTKELEVVKGYTKYEKDVLTEITKLRIDKSDIKSLSDANSQMDEVAKQIRLQAENYPELKANTVFNSLQASIADVEEHLQAARRLYNSNVSQYNQSIIVFPKSLVAKHMGLTKIDFFEVDSSKKADVSINF